MASGPCQTRRGLPAVFDLGCSLAGLWLLILVALAAAAEREPWAFHTSPALWEGPRNFQTPFDPRYGSRLFLERAVASPVDALARSPNGAYWVAGVPDGGWGVTAEGEVRCQSEETDIALLVHTERDHLLVVRIRDRYPDFQTSARWLNEKLLLVRVWWGRVLGTDAIVDVEQERFVYREMVNDGVIPFQQFAGGDGPAGDGR